MTRNLTLAIAGGLAAGILGAVVTTLQITHAEPSAASELRPASSFASIADPRERAVALFREAGKVLQHPRCVNCHPRGERPMQTDRMRPHEPLVVRGADGNGVPGMQCKTCHGDQNYAVAGVPGDPHWHLAPASMAWEGMSVGEICEQIKDPARNGKRSVAAIVEHVTTDSLVKWGWEPGADRTPAPGTNAQFGELLRAWADAGAHCPAR